MLPVQPVVPITDERFKPLLHKNKLLWEIEFDFDPSVSTLVVDFPIDDYDTNQISHRNKQQSKTFSALDPDQCTPFEKSNITSWGIKVFLTNGIDIKVRLPHWYTSNPDVLDRPSSLEVEEFGLMWKFSDYSTVTLECKSVYSAVAGGCFLTITQLRISERFFTAELCTFLDSIFEPWEELAHHRAALEPAKRKRDETEQEITKLEEKLRESKKARVDADEQILNALTYEGRFERLDVFKPYRPKSPEQLKNEERMRLIVELEEEYDHCILTPKSVKEYEDAFGCKLVLQTYPDDVVYDPANNTGLAADVLAGTLCKHFKLSYVSKFGRGSQLRECCSVLLEHLKSLTF
jgi:hypothetical protein